MDVPAASLFLSLLSGGLGFLMAALKVWPERQSLVAAATRDAVEVYEHTVDRLTTRVAELERDLQAARVEIARLQGAVGIPAPGLITPAPLPR